MKNKFKLIIITAYYPYGYSEPFLKNEIEYLSKYFDIEIFPLLKHAKHNIYRKTPSNVSVHLPILKRNYVLRFINGLFNFSPFLPFIKDFPLVFFKTPSNKTKSFISWLHNMISYRSLYANKTLRNSLQDENSILYFYWGNMPIKLFKKIKNFILIRIHGGEIDLERHNGYIPLLREKFDESKKRIYLPISLASRDILKEFKKDLNLKISRLGVLDNGLNPKSEGDIITIVSCSNIIALKRIHLIIEALWLIERVQIHWIHFGEGPLYNNMLNKTKYLSSNIRVDFKGQLSNEEIMKFYKNNHVDLFINVSEAEGIPVTIMEALSFGIPCFGTDVGGTSEILNDKAGKLVSRDFNPAILKDFIINIKELTKEYEYCEQARLIWSEKCNAENNYEDLKLFVERLFD